MTDQLDTFARVLGDLLRTQRRGRRLTRHDVVSTMDNEISVQTLASWELGTRNMGVCRLVAVSHALNMLPGPLLDRAHNLVFGSIDVPLATLNVRDLANTTVPELQALRPWADLRARELPPNCSPTIPVTRPTLDNLATLCHTTPYQLIHLLR